MQKTIYAVIDTNVIISSLITKNDDAATVKVMDAYFDGIIKAVVHEKIIAEYDEVLNRKKFSFPKENIYSILQSFKSNGLFVEPIPADDYVKDPDDVIFYEVTLSSRQQQETYLVSGNTNDFPIKPFVVTPAEMVAIVEETE